MSQSLSSISNALCVTFESWTYSPSLKFDKIHRPLLDTSTEIHVLLFMFCRPGQDPIHLKISLQNVCKNLNRKKAISFTNLNIHTFISYD